MNFPLDPIDGGELKPAEMADIDPLRLFPSGSETWTFDNKYEPTFPVRLKARISADGQARRVQLEPDEPVTRTWPPLFVQFAVSHGGLAIEQFSWLKPGHTIAFPVAPPLLVTPRVQDDHVDVLVARGWDWTYLGPEPMPRPLVPAVPGRAQKLARSLTLPGIPGSLRVAAVRVTAQNTLGNIILAATMQFVEGLGLVSYTGQANGSYFVLRRLTPLLPNTPLPVQPVFGINANELLGLAPMRNTYRSRADGKEHSLSVEGGPSDFRFNGDVPVLIGGVRWIGQGLELLELKVWGQVWKPTASVVFSTRLLNLGARPSWSMWSFEKPALKGPSNQDLSFLALRMTWSDDASDIAWADAAAGPYQNYRPRYLLIELQGQELSGKVIPAERTALVLTDQGLGILRVVRRSSNDKSEFWDLYEHA